MNDQMSSTMEVDEPAAPLEAEKKASLFIEVRDAIEQSPPYRFMVDWCASQGVTPDQISTLRLICIERVMELMSMGMSIQAAIVYIFFTFADWFDGAVARRHPDLKTSIGAKWDPYVDKLVNGSILVYLAWNIQDTALRVATTLSVSVDAFSQGKRGNIIKQLFDGIYASIRPDKYPISPELNIEKDQANTLGKVKMIVQSTSIAGLIAAGRDELVQLLSTIGLTLSSGIGLMGAMKRK